MEPVGQASRARVACRSSSPVRGWEKTNDVSPASAKVDGASWRHASQLMHVVSTKNAPGTFALTIFFGFAMTFPLSDCPECVLLHARLLEFCQIVAERYNFNTEEPPQP